MIAFQNHLVSISLNETRPLGSVRQIGSMHIEGLEALCAITGDTLDEKIDRWRHDAGAGYLTPVVASFNGTYYPGYLDRIAETLSLQSIGCRDPREAIVAALDITLLRSSSDRAGLHMPTRNKLSAEDFLAAMSVAIPVED